VPEPNCCIPPALTLAAGDEKTWQDYLDDLGAPPWLVVALVILIALAPLAGLAKTLWPAFRGALRRLSLRPHTATARGEADTRRRLASLLLKNLESLESGLPWEAETYTEIRATIESVDSPTRVRSWLRSIRRATVVYRTTSLSSALRHEREQIILLQGAPGAGKSVAMRQFAREVLEQVARGRSRECPLAIYASLGDYAPPDGSADVKSLREHIAAHANPRGSEDLAEYFGSTLTEDLHAGRVMLLLDSFDEIPAVLGSTNIGVAVMPFVDTINALMEGGPARCVVASRDYKGPRMTGWTRLQIGEMSHSEQIQLLKAHRLSADEIAQAERLLTQPRLGFSSDLRNPLHLALLAQFMSTNHRLPSRPSQLFEQYVESGIATASHGDSDDGAILLEALQRFAFDLTARDDAGLFADEEVLAQHVAGAANTSVDDPTVQRLVGGARESRLVVERRTADGRAPRISFAHRRVQEYFATRYVISTPGALSVSELALNGRWRETAVALLQVGAAGEAKDLLAELSKTLQQEADLASTCDDFEWSPAAVHVLELVVSASGTGQTKLPSGITDAATALTQAAWRCGGIGDRKFALDCLPAVHDHEQRHLVEESFAGSSDWIRTAALRDCSALHPLPSAINDSIRRLLITMIAGGRLSYEASSLDSDLGRVYGGHGLVRIRKLLAAVPTVVLVMCLAKIAYDYAIGAATLDLYSLRVEIIVWLLFPLALFWLMQSSVPLSYGGTSRLRQFFERVMHRAYGWQRGENDTETMTVVTTVMVAWMCGLSIVVGVTELVGGEVLLGIADLTFTTLFGAYVLAWGPVLLVAVRGRWLSDRATLREVALVPVEAAANVAPRMREYWRPVGTHMLFALVAQAVGVGIILGAFYLLDHYAGRVGDWVVRIATIGFVLLLPLIIVLAGIREIRSRMRVRRTLRESKMIDGDEFLRKLCSFDEPAEVAEYIRLLTLRQSTDARTIPSDLVRELVRMIERASAVDGDANVNGAIERAVLAGELTPSRLDSWSGEVLDELGRLNEMLRRRTLVAA
jgi:hypothetical protein